MPLISTRDFRFFQGRLLHRSLKVAERILDTTKNPQLVGDADHQYEDKYSLVECMTNIAIASILNVFENLEGFDEEILFKSMKRAQDENRTMTLRFQIDPTCQFVAEKTADVESPSLQTTEKKVGTDKDGHETTQETVSTHKIVTQVKEYHWKVENTHSLILFAGTDINDGIALGSRKAATTIITRMKSQPCSFASQNKSADINLTWLLKCIDPAKKKCCFSIDRDAASTPRRNHQVEEALDFLNSLQSWSSACRNIIATLHRTIFASASEPRKKFYNAANHINAENIFLPTLPLFLQDKKSEADQTDQGSNQNQADQMVTVNATPVDSPLLPMQDISNFLGEQCRSLRAGIEEIKLNFPAPTEEDQIISNSEATLALLWAHLIDLSIMCRDGIDYVERVLYNQLVQAIGKEIDSDDFDAYLRFHNKRLFPKLYSPKPFCYAIRQPGQYPDGTLSIVAGDADSKDSIIEIETFVRYTPGNSRLESMSVPLNAATTVEFVGDQYVHGWMNTSFESQPRNKHFLSARARQFSCFLLVTGTLSGPNEFSPKDAILLQNKDEVLIPLLTSVLPSAKQFKDAIKSLSPEQTRFAKSFRAMQIGTSIFGICVIQVKPQLEALLNLPLNSLMKEIQLTQDLLSLFVEHQIPSTLVSFDGPVTEDPAAKVAAVKSHVERLMSVIEGIKDKEFENEVKKADMRTEMAANLAGADMPHWVDMPHGMDSSRQKVLGAALDWLRKNEPNPEEVDEPTLAPLSKLSGTPMPKKLTPKNKKKVLDDVVDFLRINDLEEKEVNGPTLDAIANLAGLDMPRSRDPPRARALGDALDWLRSMPVDYMDTADMGDMADWEDAAAVADTAAPEMQPTNFYTASSLLGNKGNFAIAETTQSREETAIPSRDDTKKAISDPGGIDDITSIPKKLDSIFETFDKENALRTMILETGNQWKRKRQKNLLTELETSALGIDDQKAERNKALDLLDALSRSGSLPVASGEMHVMIGVQHSFERNLMTTVIEKNMNPIEKVDYSSLLIASCIHDVNIPTLTAGSGEPPPLAISNGNDETSTNM